MSSFVIQQTDNRLARTSQDKQTLVLQIIGRPTKFKKSLRRAQGIDRFRFLIKQQNHRALFGILK